jgi:hypothetical protein
MKKVVFILALFIAVFGIGKPASALQFNEHPDEATPIYGNVVASSTGWWYKFTSPVSIYKHMNAWYNSQYPSTSTQGGSGSQWATKTEWQIISSTSTGYYWNWFYECKPEGEATSTYGCYFSTYWDEVYDRWVSGLSPESTAPDQGLWSIISNYPILCQQNTTDDFTGTAYGVLYNNDSSTYYFNKIDFQAADIYSGVIYHASTTFSDLAPGSSHAFNISYDFPASTTYEVQYQISGYNLPWGVFSLPQPMLFSTEFYINWYGSQQGLACHTTFGLYSASTSDIFLPPPEQPELDDCSGLSWITDFGEKLWCNINNIIKGAFIPSASSSAKLSATLNMTKERAPYNYVSVLGTAMASIIDPTTTATSLQAMTNFADGISQINFFVYLRNIFSGFLMLILGFSFYKILQKTFK